MAQITISLDGEERDGVHALARACRLSIEEWAREAITRSTDMLPAQPRDPHFGPKAGKPAVVEAVDEVVVQRHQTSQRAQ